MLELLATKHDDWVRIAFSMTGNIDDAQDLVQDMYLRLDRLGKTKEEISYKDTVNRYFVWTVLFNMYKVSRRSKVHKKLETCELLGNEAIQDVEYNLDESYSFESITSKIDNIIKDWKPYDKKLFDLYFMQGLSLRNIAKGAGIGLNSIHNSVKSYREILREELSEDLMDYFNGDYDKID
jgi:RNA polymerase sigma factor (sigma-70 family)